MKTFFIYLFRVLWCIFSYSLLYFALIGGNKYAANLTTLFALIGYILGAIFIFLGLILFVLTLTPGNSGFISIPMSKTRKLLVATDISKVIILAAFGWWGTMGGYLFGTVGGIFADWITRNWNESKVNEVIKERKMTKHRRAIYGD